MNDIKCLEFASRHFLLANANVGEIFSGELIEKGRISEEELNNSFIEI